jgi:aldose 1-epimerase
MALESEFLPDSPNHAEWPQPDCILRPGQEYVSETVYQFIAR